MDVISKLPQLSIMIPAYGTGQYLKQTLDSAIEASKKHLNCEIIVVENPSQSSSIQTIVADYLLRGIRHHVNEINIGPNENWNQCINLARGEFIHILHDDDYILPGFYDEIEKSIQKCPDASLYATRAFLVDATGIIDGVTPRIGSLENGRLQPSSFFYQTPIQCCSVVVRRSAYELIGKFRTDLVFTADCEMWSRITNQLGAWLSPSVLACYRMTNANETSRLLIQGEDLADIIRLNKLMAETFPEFDPKLGTRRLLSLAEQNQTKLHAGGYYEAAENANRIWQRHAPLSMKIKRAAKRLLNRFNK